MIRASFGRKIPDSSTYKRTPRENGWRARAPLRGFECAAEDRVKKSP